MASLDVLIEDIQSHLDTLEDAVKKYGGATTSSSQQELIQRMQREVQYIEPKMPQLESALRKSSEADEFEEDVKTIRSDFASNKAQFCRINDEFQKAKLVGTSEAALETGNSKQRSAIDNLKKANTDADDVNNVLTQDLLTLEDDHAHLDNIHSNVKEIDNQAEIGMSRGARMMRRICFHKFISWIIVIILAAVLGVILWLRFDKGRPLYCHKKAHKEEEVCKKK